MKPMTENELVQKTRQLDRQIQELVRKGVLMTPAERFFVTRLKRERLKTKDRLLDMTLSKAS